MRRTQCGRGRRVKLASAFTAATALVDLLGRVEQPGRQARVRRRVGAVAGDDLAARTASRRPRRGHAVDLEAGDAGRQRRVDIGVRSFTLPAMAASPCLQRRRQLVDARGDARLADREVKAERLGQRPAVLERLEAARRDARPGRQRLGRLALHPQLERRPVERRDGPWCPFQASGRPQTMPVPRGPNSHLWQPATKKSQPRSATESVLDAEAVHAVDAQEHAVGLGALLVHVGERVGDRAGSAASRPSTSAPR